MDRERRAIVTAIGLTGAVASALAPWPALAQRQATRNATSDAGGHIDARALGVKPDARADQTAALQAALDTAAAQRVPLLLPAGRYRTGTLILTAGAALVGIPRATVIEQASAGPLVVASRAPRVAIKGVDLDGRNRAIGPARNPGLVQLEDVADVELEDVSVLNSRANGVSLLRCGGRLRRLVVDGIGGAAIFALDGRNLSVTDCTVQNCANNGILVWQSDPRYDGALIANNVIEKIRAEAGGTGENGNAINVFRAGNVIVSGNRIADCAFSAVRGNAASNIQIVNNTAARLGEVAIYSEFGFQGAVIANNIVDTAEVGISVTNYNDGGRLAVVQGNLIRNIFRRPDDPQGERGIGIGVEADTAVTGNVVEGAPFAGILIGTGRFMRNVVATGNIVRRAAVGFAVTFDETAGAALIAQNLIDGATRGAIIRVDHGKLVGDDLVEGQGFAGVRLAGNIATR
ncbi:MAG: TIGR03808 family TAT-translocated repetitive protein [Hyphomicrobiaceae bacterium]